jgi:hypothetical protein
MRIKHRRNKFEAYDAECAEVAPESSQLRTRSDLGQDDARGPKPWTEMQVRIGLRYTCTHKRSRWMWSCCCCCESGAPPRQYAAIAILGEDSVVSDNEKSSSQHSYHCQHCGAECI